jgi:hypothetical protein
VCTFCTMCGEIGHRKRSCRVQRDTSVQWSQDELHFASWPQYSASSIPGYGRYISESEWLVEVCSHRFQEIPALTREKWTLIHTCSSFRFQTPDMMLRNRTKTPMQTTKLKI